jgi:hypothetical protein
MSNSYSSHPPKQAHTPLAFRIAHMGDITIAEVKELCGWINDEIK